IYIAPYDITIVTVVDPHTVILPSSELQRIADCTI
ncbi:unnamed protein product, partial [marine sediment metagenome]